MKPPIEYRPPRPTASAARAAKAQPKKAVPNRQAVSSPEPAPTKTDGDVIDVKKMSRDELEQYVLADLERKAKARKARTQAQRRWRENQK